METLRASLNIQPALNLQLNERVNELKSAGMKIHHLGFGQSPFPVPEQAQRSLRENADKAEYVAVKGLLQTRELICKLHSRLDGLERFTADDVIIGPGSKDLLFLLMNVLRGDIYLLSPTWTTYKPQAQIAGRNTHIIRTSPDNGWKVTPSLLQSSLNNAIPGSLLVLCNPDNPTGACYTKNELQDIAKVIQKCDIIVLCDEIYARLTYDADHNTLVKYLPDRAILSSGISKWASCGGWRFGYQLYPKKLRPVLDAVQALASNSYTCCSSPIQYAAQTLLRFDNDASEYVQHCSRILQAVGNYCANTLLDAGVKVSHPQAGYYIFPDFEIYREKFEARGIRTGEQMCDAILEEAGVALLAGGPAFLDREDRFTVRLCFINFDGRISLKASRALGLSTALPQSFPQEYCKGTTEAVDNIVRWLQSLQVSNGVSDY
ncbi:aspartate aminotransferase-like [Styela clava]